MRFARIWGQVMAEERETETISVRVAPSLKAAVEAAAKADDRKLAAFVKAVLTRHLRATGFINDINNN